jgi:hypothetical protein
MISFSLEAWILFTLMTVGGIALVLFLIQR